MLVSVFAWLFVIFFVLAAMYIALAPIEKIFELFFGTKKIKG